MVQMTVKSPPNPRSESLREDNIDSHSQKLITIRGRERGREREREREGERRE